MWDSRLIHWNASPVGEQVRFTTYVCYCPRSLMAEEDLARKLEIFKQRKCTTHWPVSVPLPPPKLKSGPSCCCCPWRERMSRC